MRTKRALAFVMALVLSFTTFTSDLGAISVFAEPSDDSAYEEYVETATEEASVEEVVAEMTAGTEVEGVKEEASVETEDSLAAPKEENVEEVLPLVEETEENKSNLEDEDINVEDSLINEEVSTELEVASTEETVVEPKVFTDSANGITVKVTDAFGAFPSGTQMIVKPVVSKLISEEIGSEEYVAFDITFIDAERKEIQPAKEVKVEFIKALEDANTNIELFHMEDLDAVAEPVASNVTEDGTVAFEASGFSIYVFVPGNYDSYQFSTTVSAQVILDYYSHNEGDTRIYYQCKDVDVTLNFKDKRQSNWNEYKIDSNKFGNQIIVTSSYTVNDKEYKSEYAFSKVCVADAEGNLTDVSKFVYNPNTEALGYLLSNTYGDGFSLYDSNNLRFIVTPVEISLEGNQYVNKADKSAVTTIMAPYGISYPELGAWLSDRVELASGKPVSNWMISVKKNPKLDDWQALRNSATENPALVSYLLGYKDGENQKAKAKVEQYDIKFTTDIEGPKGHIKNGDKYDRNVTVSIPYGEKYSDYWKDFEIGGINHNERNLYVVDSAYSAKTDKRDKTDGYRYSFLENNKLSDDAVCDGRLENVYIHCVPVATKYTITYMDGDSVKKTEQLAIGEQYTFPEIDSKEGYTLSGWVDEDGKSVGETFTAAKDTILYTNWTPTSFEINLDENGGSYVEGYEKPATYNSATGLSLPTANQITRNGYEFDGWYEQYTDGTEAATASTQIEVGETGDKIFKAHWDAISYQITYSGVDGATNTNPNAYTIADPVILVAPTKEGFIFKGWEDSQGETTTGFDAGETGDKLFTATWYATCDEELTISGNDQYEGWLKRENEYEAYLEGYQIKVGDSDWAEKITLNTEETSVNYKLKDIESGYIVGEEEDGVACEKEFTLTYNVDHNFPTVELKVEGNPFTAFVDNLTFGHFFKNKAALSIDVTDGESGPNLESRSYYLSSEALTDARLRELPDEEWKTYVEGVKIDAGWKGMIYAKASDNVGHETIVSSDGTVVYRYDSQMYGGTISYNKVSDYDQDKTTNLDLMDNTVRKIQRMKQVGYNGWELVETLNDSAYSYDSEKDEITLTREYLRTLKAGHYNFEVYYNPYGVSYGDDDNLDLRAYFSIDVSKFTDTPTVTLPDWTYDKQYKAPIVKQSEVGTKQKYEVEYFVNGSWVKNQPIDAGNYKVRAHFFANDYYNEVYSAEDSFTINQRIIKKVVWYLDGKEIKPDKNNNYHLTFDGNDHTITAGFYTIGSNVLLGDKVEPKYNESDWLNTYTRTARNHNEAGYTASIWNNEVSNPNYRIDGNKDFSTYIVWFIDPCNVNLTWKVEDENHHSVENTTRAGVARCGYTAREYTVEATLNGVPNADKENMKNAITLSNNKGTAVASYTTTAGIDDWYGNYNLTNDTFKWEIFYHDFQKVNVFGSKNMFGWYKGDITLSKRSWNPWDYTNNYLITDKSPLLPGNQPDWRNSLVVGKEGKNVELKYYLQTWDGYVSPEKTFTYSLDKTAPTGEIKLGFDTLDKDLKWFVKNGASLWTTSNDTNSGVASVSYSYDGWFYMPYNQFIGIPVSARKDYKNIYVKITDWAGNETVLHADELIVYNDAEAVTTEAEYTRTTKEDVTITVNPHGNTIKNVKLFGMPLVRGIDYTVSGDNKTITLKGAYLDRLPGRMVGAMNEVQPYFFSVSYNPLGKAYNQYVEIPGFWNIFTRSYVGGYSYGDSKGADAFDTFFTINVKKATDELVITNDLSKTYDGAPVSSNDVSFNSLSDGNTVIEYKVKGADDDTYTETAPVNAGDYTVRVTKEESFNYYASSAEKDFTIAKRNVIIETLSDSKVQGSADPAFRAVVRNAIEPVSAFAWRIVGNEAPGEYEISHTIAPSEAAYPNYSFTIIHGTFTITALPVEVVTLPGPTFTPLAATPVEAEEVEEVEEVEEEEIVIEEPATPEAPEVEEEPTVEIAEEPVPETVAARCVMHWAILGLAALYAAYVVVRALQNKKELDGDEETANN